MLAISPTIVISSAKFGSVCSCYTSLKQFKYIVTNLVFISFGLTPKRPNVFSVFREFLGNASKRACYILKYIMYVDKM